MALPAFSQNGPEVNQSIGTPVTSVVQLFYRDGSNNTTYICRALANQPTFSWTRSLSTLTSIAVATNVGTVTTSTAHGLSVGNRVSFRGATVDTDLNGDYVIATVGSSTTFTVATVNVADATYNEATLLAYTNWPRTNATVWSINRLFYTTIYADRSSWAEGSTAYGYACDSRTTYAY